MYNAQLDIVDNSQIHPSPADQTPKQMLPIISVVIPLHNEEDNIPHLYNELSTALNELKQTYEVIVIDDGSSDKSFLGLKAIHEQDPCWRILQLRRNFGQTSALAAGFDAARGEIIITMDADLQNDSHDISKLLEKMSEGYDIVCGWRLYRKEPFFSRRLPSMLANRMISRTTNVTLHDYGCTLKAYRAEVVKNIKLYGELHRFIPAIASWMGVIVCEVPVNDRARRFGKSKYGIGRTFRVVLDLITVSFLLRFSTKPLRVFGGIGLFLGAVGVALGLYLTYARIFLNEDLGNRPALLLAALLILLAIQMISIGLVAEMVMRSYFEPQGRPTYLIRNRLDATESDKE